MHKGIADARLSGICDNGQFKLLIVAVILEVLVERLSLQFGTDCPSDYIALFQKVVYNPHCDVTIRSGDEYTSVALGFGCSRHDRKLKGRDKSFVDPSFMYTSS